MSRYLAVRATNKTNRYGFPVTEEVPANDLVKQTNVTNDVPTLTRPEMFPTLTETESDPVDSDGVPMLGLPSMSFEGQSTPTSTPSADDGIPILDVPEMDFSR